MILRADENRHTLLDFMYQPKWQAENGKPGEGARKDGRCGEDLYIQVPVGTQVLDPETRAALADLSVHGEEFVLARGGRGGLGNTAYKSATNRAPEQSQPGEAGEAGSFLLSLKLVADVGLIGLPNAGKSTLISRISAARPKIADYPFTTLTPNLGVVGRGERSFVVADIPGLIPGAHQGKGLGIRFLKHVERTKLLVHLIDVTAAAAGHPADLVATHRSIRHELELFSPDLARKEEIVILTKCDAVTESVIEEARAALVEQGVDTAAISSASGRGIDELLNEIHRRLAKRIGDQPE